MGECLAWVLPGTVLTFCSKISSFSLKIPKTKQNDNFTDSIGLITITFSPVGSWICQKTKTELVLSTNY